MTVRSRKERQSEQETPSATPAGLLDVEEAAAWLKVSRSKLFELMHEDDFPVIEISGKLIRFDPNSLYKWALKRQKAGRWVLSSE
jgi:predicted DNA-binding transcriptional regulator AlpA